MQLKAERTTHQKHESRQKKVIEDLFKSIGIDPDSTPDHLTLGEIGLESMFALKIQQEFEREFNIKVGLNNIKNITVKILKDIGDGKTDYIKSHLDDLKKTAQMLKKYKFIIPNESHTKLNAVKTGKPVYFLPPFEVTFSAFEELSKKFDRPVIGLNWTKDMNKFETIKELSNYYFELLKKLEPNGKYDLVGYLDGALVISKLLYKGVVNKAVIVDINSDQLNGTENLSDDFIIESIIAFMSDKMPKMMLDKIKREIDSMKDFGAKLQKIATELKDFGGRELIATDLEEILRLMAKRLKMSFNYRYNKRIDFSNKLKEKIGKKLAEKTGKLVVIKGLNFEEESDVNKEIESTRQHFLIPSQMVNNFR